MLVFPENAPVDAAEWRTWLEGPEMFGALAVNNTDPAGAPLVVPAHATLTGDEVVLHLARVNPVWKHLEAATEVRFVVTGDSAYVRNDWRAKPGVPPAEGVPTSYYASVQFRCGVQVVDDPAGIAEVLTWQFADLQPDGGHAEVSPTDGPYARMLPAIRALRLPVREVVASFKYDDEKPTEHRERVAAHLEERGRGSDAGAAAQQRRRLREVGERHVR
ncbi:FMN-binding negative transcriptional regulator [Kytococcus sedentarius]|uniref:Transcriptional regulator n=1 Tax=Kytococcus sedentarius (strain ATCC 14392 / DSM 20547 / JCM 11482 / CCUG 33030 / NBRC 15357 / NCTC 11040 / CCM 314 / 541) TaxID=478801 RepID=C7NJM9_KYTSD|nr:FMN-binding negative transcriptional regulator [Kytococcus sedentarius]ACV05359.1 transcriptional regulator [Kytococcus sedentarius DSM 20547]QQB63807.1 FMN-binding negative transcriptional regulator [Kytococcus sedentarius]STX13226.1 Putative FMN-binding domain [Kytococcus sedentarius]